MVKRPEPSIIKTMEGNSRDSVVMFLYVCESHLGCPSKLVSIWNNRNWNQKTSFGTIRNKMFVSVVSLLYWNRVLMFRLNRNKQFDREHILLFFTENLGFLCFFDFFCLSIFFCFFRFVFICFETICFDCFASLPKQRVSMFRLNRNKLKTHPNSLK